MNGSALEKVLLSAMLTSCTVFSVLTLVFLPRRAEPILSEPTVIESIEDINQRDVVIRHIGLSIVVSVGAGITTAELMRQWGRSRKVAPDGRQVLSAQSTLQTAEKPDMTIAVNGPTASLHALTSDRLPTDRLELQTHAMSSDHDGTSKNAALPLALFQPPMPLPTADTNWFPPTPSDSALPASLTELMHTGDWAPTWHPILTSRERYQTCRIHRSDASERLFAILFDEQYYRFVKTASDRERALSIATRLDQRGEPAVITHAEGRYTVWALEPDAHLEAMALSVAASETGYTETYCCAERLEQPNLVAA